MGPTYQERCRALNERCSDICDELEEVIDLARTYRVAALAEQLVSLARDLDHFAGEWEAKAREDFP